MKILEGKTAIVTGASRGIGKEIALFFAKEGADVAFTDLFYDENAENLEKELSSLGIKAKGYASDASSFKNSQEIVGEILKDFGKVDILVNNAGLAVGLNTIQNGEIDDWERMIDTNIKGLLYISRKISPMMISR